MDRHSRDEVERATWDAHAHHGAEHMDGAFELAVDEAGVRHLDPVVGALEPATGSGAGVEQSGKVA